MMDGAFNLGVPSTPRAGVGRPTLDEWTPAEYYTPDCLHPSEAGFRHLFRELARTLEAG